MKQQQIDQIAIQGQVKTPLSLSEMGGLLIKHYGLHEGLYDISIEFSIGIGAVGPTKELMSPGAMIGVQKIGLVHALEKGPLTIDASLVNPQKKSRKK